MWKGSKKEIGYYRGTPVWNILINHNLIPKECFEPFSSKEKTLARLKEVIHRKNLIGAHFNDGIEEKCSKILDDLHVFHFRLASSYSEDEQKYLKEVYNNDKEEIDLAEFSYVEKEINRLQFMELNPISWHINFNEVKMLSLQEIKKDLCRYKWIREEIVERVYNKTFLEWQEKFKKRNERTVEIKNKYNK